MIVCVCFSLQLKLCRRALRLRASDAPLKVPTRPLFFSCSSFKTVSRRAVFTLLTSIDQPLNFKNGAIQLPRRLYFLLLLFLVSLCPFVALRLFLRLTRPAGSLVEDIGEMILQLRRQVESLFSIKYGKLQPPPLPPHAHSMTPRNIRAARLLFLSRRAGPARTGHGALLQVPDVPGGPVRQRAARRHLHPPAQLLRSGQAAQDLSRPRAHPVRHQKVKSRAGHFLLMPKASRRAPPLSSLASLCGRCVCLQARAAD